MKIIALSELILPPVERVVHEVEFGLAVAPDKTRTLPLYRCKPEPNEAFEFLGFEFRWVR